MEEADQSVNIRFSIVSEIFLHNSRSKHAYDSYPYFAQVFSTLALLNVLESNVCR